MILRRLLSASASGLAFLALSAGPASADPVSTFIIGAIGLTGTAAAVAGFVIKTALWTGASHLIGKVLRPRKQGAQARQADIASLSLGEVPREMIVGRAVTGGSLVQGFNHGGANGTDNETLVIAIADERCDGLEGVFVDDQFIAHTGDGDVTGTSGGLNIRWRNGATGQTLPSDLRAMAGFTAADRLAGVAHVWVTYTAKWAQERGGRPRLRFRVRGGRRYDPRKDSTVPGGSGAHRWNNPATWEWTENLILNRYAYQRGVFCEGRVTEPEQLWVGRGLSAVEAPPERIIAWANLCDEAVALKGGGTEPRWRVGGVIRADETYIEVDEKFAAACGGTIIQPEGGIEVEPGHGKASVVHITDDDLMAGEPVQFSEFLPETERFNTVVTRYVDPGQDWQFHSAPVRRSTADIAADGGPYTLPVDLELVTSGTQAQRVGEILRRKARLENRATIPLGPRFSWLEAGDWVVWTSARWLRGATKTFRITADPLDEGWRMKAALEEMQSAVFGWTPASDEITPQTAPPDLWSKPGPISLTGVGVAVIDRGGVPGLRFTWVTPVDPAISSVTVEARIKGETQTVLSLTREPNKGQLDITDGIAPETLMEARAWPAGALDRDIQASPWVEIGAGILRAGVILGPDGQPITGGDILKPRPYAADTIKSTFSSLTGLSASNAALATVGSGHSVSFTPTGAGTATYLQWVLGRPGDRAHRVRLRVRAVGAAITAAMWDGRLTYSTPALAHALTAGRFATIPFPAGGLPAGEWRDIEFVCDGLTDYLDSTINQVRFYLVKPTSGRIDIGRVEAGYAGGATEGAQAGKDLFRTDGVTPMTQAEVRTPEGVALDFIGRGDFALLNSLALTDPRLTGKSLANLDGSANTKLTGIQPLATVGARAGTNLFRTDGLTVMSQAEVRTPEGVALDFMGRGDLALQNRITASQVQLYAAPENMIPDPFFQDQNYWNASNGANWQSNPADANLSSLTVPRALQFNSTEIVSVGLGMTAASGLLPVQPSKPYHFEWFGRFVSGFTAYCYVYLQHFDKDGNSLGTGGTNRIGTVMPDYRTTALGTSTTLKRTVEWVSPATAAFVQVQFFCFWSSTLTNASRGLVGKMALQRMVPMGELLAKANGGLAAQAEVLTIEGVALDFVGRGPFATVSRPVTAIQYLNDSGRINDGRGLPLNTPTGHVATMNPAAPLSPGGTPSTQIAVAATTITFAGGATQGLPSATISGLTADTRYAVFRDLQTSTYLAVATGMTPYLTSADRYLFLGYRRTELSGGGYTPPPAPPPGGGGGWGDDPLFMDP